MNNRKHISIESCQDWIIVNSKDQNSNRKEKSVFIRILLFNSSLVFFTINPLKIEVLKVEG